MDAMVGLALLQRKVSPDTGMSLWVMVICALLAKPPNTNEIINNIFFICNIYGLNIQYWRNNAVCVLREGEFFLNFYCFCLIRRAGILSEAGF
jgi:hypothetical protein